MGCKDNNGLGKYRQGITTNLREYCRSRIIGMADKVSGEYSGRQAWWRISGTTWMDTAMEEMWDGNIRDVGRWIWKNVLEEWQRSGQILTGNNYQREGISSL